MASYVKKCNADCRHRVWGGNYFTDLCGEPSISVGSSGQCLQYSKVRMARWDPYKKYGVLSDIEEEIEKKGQTGTIVKTYPWGKAEIMGTWRFTPRPGDVDARVHISIFVGGQQEHGWSLGRKDFGWEVPEDDEPRWAFDMGAEEVSGPEEGIQKAKAWVLREIQKYK